MKRKSAAAAGSAAVPLSASPVRTSTNRSDPAPEEIARLAYSYWEARGCQGGSAEQDWLNAEIQLKTRSVAAGK